MKLNETINSYRIVTEPTNQSGGNCVWAFAERSGKRWFIKEFLAPKYPLETSPGSAKSKAARRELCETFERRHRRIMDAINPRSPGSGNLVTASDFFRAGTTYYKVTEPVVPQPMPLLHEVEPRRAGVLIKTLVLSLKLLHEQEIVHGDLKPNNILVQTVPGSTDGLASSKLIDFDDSYFEGEPPSRDAIGGDPRYASPEWFGYNRSYSAIRESDMTRASDVFTLGLVIHNQLVGAAPEFDERRFEGCPGLAALAGEPITVNAAIHPTMRALIEQMLAADARKRPATQEIARRLVGNEMFARYEAAPAPSSDSGKVSDTGSRVKTSMGRRPTEPLKSPEASTGSADTPSTRIRLNFRPRTTGRE